MHLGYVSNHSKSPFSSLTSLAAIITGVLTRCRDSFIWVHCAFVSEPVPFVRYGYVDAGCEYGEALGADLIDDLCGAFASDDGHSTKG